VCLILGGLGSLGSFGTSHFFMDPTRKDRFLMKRLIVQSKENSVKEGCQKSLASLPMDGVLETKEFW